MDPNILTKILAAGAMGASIFCIWKVYDLLRNEQDKEEPRPIFIRTIYVAMGFAVIMTLLSLGIEVVRHNMGMEVNNSPVLDNALQRLSENTYYSLDQDGNPLAMSLPLGDSTLVLSEALPRDFYQNNELTIKLLEDKYLVQRENKGQIMTAGQLRPSQIEGLLNSSPPAPSSEADIGPNELLNLGLSYSPSTVVNAVNLSISREESLAVNYLIQLLDDKYSNKPDIQKKAVRLLIQPQLMNALNRTQYDALIKALESGKIRPAPYSYYELAQVYHSRAFQTRDKQKRAEDLNQYRDNLGEYIQFYEEKTWIQDADDYPTEALWYKNAKNELQ